MNNHQNIFGSDFAEDAVSSIMSLDSNTSGTGSTDQHTFNNEKTVVNTTMSSCDESFANLLEINYTSSSNSSIEDAPITHVLEPKTSSYRFINDTHLVSSENFIHRSCNVPFPIINEFTQPTSEEDDTDVDDDSINEMRRPLETIYEDEQLVLPPRKPGPIRLNSLYQHHFNYNLERAPIAYSVQERLFRKPKRLLDLN